MSVHDDLAELERKREKKEKERRNKRTPRRIVLSFLGFLQSLTTGGTLGDELGRAHPSLSHWLLNLGTWEIGLMLPFAIASYWAYRFLWEAWDWS